MHGVYVSFVIMKTGKSCRAYVYAFFHVLAPKKPAAHRLCLTRRGTTTQGGLSPSSLPPSVRHHT